LCQVTGPVGHYSHVVGQPVGANGVETGAGDGTGGVEGEVRYSTGQSGRGVADASAHIDGESETVGQKPHPVTDRAG
jgi:hypothetical protein